MSKQKKMRKQENQQEEPDMGECSPEIASGSSEEKKDSNEVDSPQKVSELENQLKQALADYQNPPESPIHDPRAVWIS